MFHLHRDSPSSHIRQNLRRRHLGRVQEGRASGTPLSSVTGRLGSRNPIVTRFLPDVQALAPVRRKLPTLGTFAVNAAISVPTEAICAVADFL